MVEYLVFDLPKRHRSRTKGSWKYVGLVFENNDSQFKNDLAFHVIYKRCIFARKCELCNTVFQKSNHRYMEHCHATGEFRNIVCNSCNLRKSDVKIKSNNTSGYKGISKYIHGWQFRVMIKGKKHSKYMPDLDKLIEYAERWKRENNYYT